MRHLCHQWKIGLLVSLDGPGLGRTVTLLGVLATLSVFFVPAPAAAQTNTASESRYLLIFDTSSAMKRRSENVQQVVGELVYSGMNGQMHAGDTIGVWTFNETLQAGNLPLMRWAPERRKGVASRVTDFLRAQKFEKTSRFDTVLPSLQQVVANSTKLTVLVFSDGTSSFSGTPFDVEINAAYAPFRETQRQERMPFVTVLRVKDQEYLGYAVTPSPWAVEFPKFPPDPVVVAPKAEPKTEPVRPVVAPLIVIGKKDTNTAPAVVLPQPGTEPKPPPKPEMTEAEKLFAKLAAEQGLNVESAGNANATPQQLPVETSTPAITPSENAKPTPPPLVAEPPKPAPLPAVTNGAPPKAIVEPPAATVASNAPSTETKPGPAVQAVVAPVDKQASWLLLVAASVSLLVLALVVIYALMRRRHRAHVSLITSSMDRRRK